LPGGPALLAGGRARSARRHRRRAGQTCARRCVLDAVLIDSGAEQRLEFPSQHYVDFCYRHRDAEINETGDAVSLLAHPTGHDTEEMRKVGIDIERHAMQRHPLLHADTNGGDLVLMSLAFVGPAYPDADAIFAPLAAYIESGERADNPFFQRGHEAAHVRPAPF